MERVDRGAADVLAEGGSLTARWSAAVRRSAASDPVTLPCVGDWVALRLLPEGRHEVAAVLPRRTAIVRGGVGRYSRGGRSGDGQGQVLAANVDLVLVAEPCVHGSDPADLGRIERLVALAWESGAQPVVLLLTKADLVGPSLADLLTDVTAAAPGVEVWPVSTVTGAGIEAVAGSLPGARTAVVLGPFGAGKSSLVNALAGGKAMETQRVRASDGRGRHTTVHRELIALPGGALIIDTPGLRRIGMYAGEAAMDLTFADVADLAASCRFADCAHEEEPGCAVLDAVAGGELPERRLASWRKLRREAAWMTARADGRARQEEKRRGRQIELSLRRTYQHRP